MQDSVSTSAPNPVLAAALARPPRRRPAPRGGREVGFSGNNYIAERKKAGAKPGNRNARKHGHYAAKRLAMNRALRRHLRGVNALCAEIGRMCQARTARGEIDRFIATNMPISARGAFLEWVADDEPRPPLSL